MERVQKIQKFYELRKFFTLSGILYLLFFIVFTSGCAMTYPRPMIDNRVVPLKPVQTEIPESDLLDVRIQVFEPGKIPENKDKARGISTEIREAESKYIACELKESLQQCGNFGAIRVVPDESAGDEILVTGKVLKSNGEELKLEASAFDARGEKWFNKKFKAAISMEKYKDVSEKKIEIFQTIYNQIANEIIKHRIALTPEEVKDIRTIAEMRFAENLAPKAFDGYLKEEKKGKIIVDRLPSDGDEMMARVRAVRERDYILADTIDAYYEGFHREMFEVYTNWRKSRLTEMNMIREVDKKKNEQIAKGATLIVAGAALGAAAANSRGYNQGVASSIGAATGAGVALMLTADQISEEAEINKVALEELGTSFGAEIEPITVEVEGKTIQLTGTAEAKFKQWSEILNSIYETETEVDPYLSDDNTPSVTENTNADTHVEQLQQIEE